MTEDIIYADLKFENNHELENIRDPENTKEKGSPTSTRSCQPLVLVFFMLCLALLMVLVILAVLFFQIPKDYRTQLRDLNMTKNELQANFSNMLQVIGNQLCLEGKKTLKNNGQNCALCPANWKWEGGDMCYHVSDETKPWEQSLQFCASRNSTLLTKGAENLELIKKGGREYWLGLKFRAPQGDWYWVDNTVYTGEKKSCSSCTDKHYFICEKPAIQLQRGNNHWQEDWFVRLK
ncbi:PREDICTED: C-type lectin domain family 12 member A-like [Apaloderma vittatum]|uniref:C-type lectin domain family 12 member A-like n=1 Tax=Apaloderma vittatum TaxID=57397 RepID=UPI00052134C1|nr:PREDICTED: C-type lectin domain family 12 member A-like [Apaloderma vittatum]